MNEDDDRAAADATGRTDAESSQRSEAIRGEVRETGYRRVSHGLYLPLVSDLDAGREFLRDLKAWRLLLPADAVFTHITGARILGWQLPQLPEQVPTFVAVAGDATCPRRPGLICARLVRPATPVFVHGVPVEQPEEILLRAARDLGLLDLVIMVDSARRHGHVDDKRMAAVLQTSRPGVRRLRKAWDLSDPRSDSGPETVLRIFHVVMNVPVEPQAVITDSEGNVIAHADLRVIGTDRLQEYDGEVHRDPAQHRVDLRRERGLAGTPYERHGYTLDDMLNHPLVMMHELDRLLARPHRLVRLRRWQALVENSLYSETGRQRVMNRWRYLTGTIEWWETA